MFGKHHESTYTGSMYGAGFNVFAVWGYVIANAGPDHRVELNPRMLAGVLGGTTTLIVDAIEFLCREDPDSRTKVEGGRRLVREGEFLYFVVNHETYKTIRSNEERREYFRVKQAEHREKVAAKGAVKDSQGEVSTVKASRQTSKPMSTHTETETETETETTEGDGPRTREGADTRPAKERRNPLVDRDKLEREGMALIAEIAALENIDPTVVALQESKYRGVTQVNMAAQSDDWLANTVERLRKRRRRLRGEPEPFEPETTYVNPKAQAREDGANAELRAGILGDGTLQGGASGDGSVLAGGVPEARRLSAGQGVDAGNARGPRQSLPRAPRKTDR